MTYHCHRCGAPLASAPPVECPACGYAMFLNARPTASVIIVDGDRFLALMRAREPNAGRWDLPGGFCDGWELPRDAAVREAREELGVAVRLDQFVGMYLGEYQFQGELLPVLDMFWLATIVDGQLRPDPSEATDHGWLPLRDPPSMAFSTMDSALPDAAAMLVRGH
ncbi:NUDIX domain-containing protein [Rugosimonospora acidiphila]|uniref:NUDIX domain-containing protein n=1 Tax=Rugosimonospora acidiphila TaxID=556531 RepID=A0ABP9RSM2_9ACTN